MNRHFCCRMPKVWKANCHITIKGEIAKCHLTLSPDFILKNLPTPFDKESIFLSIKKRVFLVFLLLLSFQKKNSSSASPLISIDQKIKSFFTQPYPNSILSFFSLSPKSSPHPRFLLIHIFSPVDPLFYENYKTSTHLALSFRFYFILI